MHADIYVDLDDVLGETSRMFLALLLQKFGKQVEYEQLTSFSLSRSLGLSSQDLEEFVRLAHSGDALMTIAPVAGAKTVLGEWRDRGGRISVVTGRPPETASVSCEWLVAHRIPFDRILFVDKYRRARGAQPGLLSLEDISTSLFDLVIEDSLEVALCLANMMNVPIVLRSCPWNLQMVDHPGIRRCEDWSEISNMLQDLWYQSPPEQADPGVRPEVS